MDPHVVVLEDDAELRSLVTRGLREEGFSVRCRRRAPLSCSTQIRGARRPDALVVDIGLPDADGRDVVPGATSARVESAPVIFLTVARRAPRPARRALLAGGDDYLTKPFAFAELVARLRALIKRGGSDLGSSASAHCVLDPWGACGLECRLGERTDLTPTEFRLLARLAAWPRVTRPEERNWWRSSPGARRHRSRQHARRVHRPGCAGSSSYSPARPGSRRCTASATRCGEAAASGSASGRGCCSPQSALSLLALVIGVTAFNLVLDQRLSDSATSLAKERRPRPEIASLSIAHNEVVSHETGPRKRDGVGGPVWVFSGRHDRGSSGPARRRRCTAVASSLAGGPERTIRAESSRSRLYALPVLDVRREAGGNGRRRSVARSVRRDGHDRIRRLPRGSAVVLLAAVGRPSHWILGEGAPPPCRGMTGDAEAEWSVSRPRPALRPPASPTTSSRGLPPPSTRLLERLSASLRHEQRVTAEMSHELRTPLARDLDRDRARAAPPSQQNDEPYRQSPEPSHRNAEHMTACRRSAPRRCTARGGSATPCHERRPSGPSRHGRGAFASGGRDRGHECYAALAGRGPVRVGDRGAISSSGSSHPLVDNAVRYGRSHVRVELGVSGTSALRRGCRRRGRDWTWTRLEAVVRARLPRIGRRRRAAWRRGSGSRSPAASPARPGETSRPVRGARLRRAASACALPLAWGAGLRRRCHREQRVAQVGDAVREVDVEPMRHVARRGLEDDLVVVGVVELRRCRRRRSGSTRPSRIRARCFLELWQRGSEGLSRPCGGRRAAVEGQVGGVWDEQDERGRPVAARAAPLR